MEIEVSVQSILQSDVQGRVKVACQLGDTIDSLISTFCIEKGVKHKSNYILRNNQDETLHNTRTIGTCGIKDGDTLYLGTPASDEKTFGYSNWWIFAAISLLIGGIGLVAIATLKVIGDPIPDDYGIVIDAGSSRTSLFVYQWKGNKYHGTGIVEQIAKCRSKASPLADYESNPENAGKSLGDCIETAKQNIPKSEWKNAPIFLGATAGMRMLRERNRTTCDKMMTDVRKELTKTPFKFTEPEKQALILTGTEEGAFAWVTVNYLLGSFGQVVRSKFKSSRHLPTNVGKSKETVGALEMGGASSQITYIPEPGVKIPEDKYAENLTLYGKQYSVFADSFLCYGKGESEKRYLANVLKNNSFANKVQSPCGPKGNILEVASNKIFDEPCVKGAPAIRTYGSAIIPNLSASSKNQTYVFEGTAEPEKCLAYVKEMFNFSASCKYDHCSFNGRYMPPIHGYYLAFSGYWYEMNFLNLTDISQPLTISRFRNSVYSLCNKTWDEVKVMRTSVKDQLPYYCYDGQFILALLLDGFHFNDTTFPQISFVQDVADTKVGWPIGLMLNATNSLPVVTNPNKLNLTLFVLLMLLFIIFILLAIGFACHAKQQRCDNECKYEQLKNVKNYGSAA
ncbi:ectonucleoside triphosphate diphosphohydrolase 8-like [Tubulanus polymorphus]|uniref:ectonucleoside triphosphate diphosphohydrolase 8-like n=1 Tax=Tubulanus polymorphus TaxID=672921 RepID=UPI003DA2A05B